MREAVRSAQAVLLLLSEGGDRGQRQALLRRVRGHGGRELELQFHVLVQLKC